MGKKQEERSRTTPATENEHRHTYPDHWERYEFAAQHVLGKKVLDVACGCGYGTAFLAVKAGRCATGLDIDHNSVEWNLKYYGSQADYISEIIAAVLAAHENQNEQFAAYNVEPAVYITVREKADIACDCLGLDPANVDYQFTGGDRGWKGDVPIVRLDIEKIKKIGWRPTRTSAQALREPMLAMLEDIRSGLE
ncbi:hypothetical protein D4S03_12545 [bacterium]|nr:MAG: hypothetical protein D4S03_12545 [bacterium]